MKMKIENSWDKRAISRLILILMVTHKSQPLTYIYIGFVFNITQKVF